MSEVRVWKMEKGMKAFEKYIESQSNMSVSEYKRWSRLSDAEISEIYWFVSLVPVSFGFVDSSFDEQILIPFEDRGLFNKLEVKALIKGDIAYYLDAHYQSMN